MEAHYNSDWIIRNIAVSVVSRLLIENKSLFAEDEIMRAIYHFVFLLGIIH